VSADLSDRAAVRAAAADAVRPFGPVDILVNASRLNIRPPLGDLTPRASGMLSSP
jgi:NAD(P)-dependent dehydrogenase (short-subunit alcohol dehydrogenase family)